MTNIIGMAIVIISTNTTTITATNHVPISCREAECTRPTQMVTISDGVKEWTEPACIVYHTKIVAVPAVVRHEVVLGVENRPLFKIVEIEVIGNNGRVGNSWYEEGAYIGAIKKPKGGDK